MKYTVESFQNDITAYRIETIFQDTLYSIWKEHGLTYRLEVRKKDSKYVEARYTYFETFLGNIVLRLPAELRNFTEWQRYGFK